MALVKAIVLKNGQFQQQQAGDTLAGPVAEVDIVSLTNGEASPITIGQVVYISASGTVKLAKADASATAKAFGVVADASIGAGASGNIQTSGVLSGLSGLTAGSQYYLSPTTAGAMTSTAPTTVGQYVTPVGKAITASELWFEAEQDILL